MDELARGRAQDRFTYAFLIHVFAIAKSIL